TAGSIDGTPLGHVPAVVGGVVAVVVVVGAVVVAVAVAVVAAVVVAVAGVAVAATPPVFAFLRGPHPTERTRPPATTAVTTRGMRVEKKAMGEVLTLIVCSDYGYRA